MTVSAAQPSFLRPLSQVGNQAYTRLPVTLQRTTDKVGQLVSYCSRSQLFNQGVGILTGVGIASYGVRYISQTLAPEPEETMVRWVDKCIDSLISDIDGLNDLRSVMEELDQQLADMDTKQKKTVGEVNAGIDSVIQSIQGNEQLESHERLSSHWVSNLKKVRSGVKDTLEEDLVEVKAKKLEVIQKLSSKLSAFKSKFDKQRKVNSEAIKVYENKYKDPNTQAFAIGIGGEAPSRFLKNLYSDIDASLLRGTDSWKQVILDGKTPDGASWTAITDGITAAKDACKQAGDDAVQVKAQRVEEGGYKRTFMKAAHLMVGVAILLAGIGIAAYAINPSLFGRVTYLSPVLSSGSSVA